MLSAKQISSEEARVLCGIRGQSYRLSQDLMGCLHEHTTMTEEMLNSLNQEQLVVKRQKQESGRKILRLEPAFANTDNILEIVEGGAFIQATYYHKPGDQYITCKNKICWGCREGVQDSPALREQLAWMLVERYPELKTLYFEEVIELKAPEGFVENSSSTPYLPYYCSPRELAATARNWLYAHGVDDANYAHHLDFVK